MPQNTYLPDLKGVQDKRKWHYIDADGVVLGRLATRCAVLLKGKHKTFFTPAIDCGDFVVVTNAAKIKLTGNKLEQKTYFSHSGYAGGAKVMPMKLQMERDPRKVVMLAVKRMLAPNRLRSPQLRRLKIYSGGKHPHASQNPPSIEASGAVPPKAERGPEVMKANAG